MNKLLTQRQVQQGALAGIKKKKAQAEKNKERYVNFEFNDMCTAFCLCY